MNFLFFLLSTGFLFFLLSMSFPFFWLLYRVFLFYSYTCTSLFTEFSSFSSFPLFPSLVSCYRFTCRSLPLRSTYSWLFLTRHFIFPWLISHFLIDMLANQEEGLNCNTYRTLSGDTSTIYMNKHSYTYDFCHPHKESNMLSVLQNHVSLTAGNLWATAMVVAQLHNGQHNANMMDGCHMVPTHCFLFTITSHKREKRIWAGNLYYKIINTHWRIQY